MEKIKNTIKKLVIVLVVFIVLSPNGKYVFSEEINNGKLITKDKIWTSNFTRKVNDSLPPIRRDLMLTVGGKNRPLGRDGTVRKLVSFKKLVVHYTSNFDATADAVKNRNWFEMGEVYGSAHYIVDDHQIVQCIEEDEFSYNCGDRNYYGKYNPIGSSLLEYPRPEQTKGKNYNYSPNWFTIGVEMCVNSDGDWNKTRENSIKLLADILYRHGRLNTEDLVRHYDISDKICPAMMINKSLWKAEVRKVSNKGNVVYEEWESFKTAVQKELDKLIVGNTDWSTFTEDFTL